jgi:regulation of enolase protein 1 (concanavalin A-like superfamily)
VRQADVRVTVSHQPKKRWEQANLVWYYSGSTMVKLGLEIENGVHNIVMGQEENDRTKTIAVIPFPSHSAELRFTVKDLVLTGYYRRPGDKEWHTAGTAALPAGEPPAPHASLQFYQGEANSGRWATLRDFQITALDD